MKVIVTVSTYYPLTDGVQSVTQYHAEGLAKLGHDVTVVTSLRSGMPKVERHNGVKIIRYNIQTKHAVHVGDKGGYRNLISTMCNDADVLLNVATQTATTEVLFPILDNLKVKKILYMHGMHDFSWHQHDLMYSLHKIWNNMRWGWDYLFNGKYLKKYDEVIQLHAFDKATTFFKDKYNIDSVIIGNAAEDIFFESVENHHGNYLLNVSNFDSRKNQEFILEAYYKSSQKNMDLILVGSRKNEYSKYLSKLKVEFDKEYGKRNVKILEKVPREGIAQLVLESSIFLLGSKWEAFPIAIVEAMAAKKPFISTDVGIVRFLPGGIIVRNSDEMAYWIDKFSTDNEVVKLLGKVGNTFATNNFSITDKIAELDTIIRRT